MRAYATPRITSPYLIDRVVQELAEYLEDNITWLEYSFGRSQRLVRKQGGKDVAYPGIYSVSGEYISLLPNEATGNTSFFIVDEPQQYLNWSGGAHNRLKCTFSIVFWYDILKIYPATTAFDTEKVRNEILTVLRTAPLTNASFRLTATSEKDVYRGYALDEVNLQHMMYPFHGLRIDGELTYTEDCTVVTPAPPVTHAYQVETLTMTKADVDNSGDIYITLDNITYTVAVLEDDNWNDITFKIYAAFVHNTAWVAVLGQYGNSPLVIFTATTTGEKASPSFDGTEVDARATIETTTLGT